MGPVASLQTQVLLFAAYQIYKTLITPILKGSNGIVLCYLQIAPSDDLIYTPFLSK